VPLDLHSNDCAREAEPGLFMFHGKWVALLPLGVLAGICIFRLLMAMGVDWFIAIPIALVPAAASAGFVHFCVNSRPPSFFFDLSFLASWRIRTWLYMKGCLDRPPCLWTAARKYSHPSDFSQGDNQE
jgi:hypothetical protein